MKKKIFIIFFLIIVVLIGLFEKKDDYNLLLEVSSKKTLKESLKALPKSENLFFKLYLKYRNGGKNIKAGYYEIRGKYNIRQLVSLLESGKSKVYKFTIIEGSSVKNVIDKLVEEKKGDREKFIQAFDSIDFPYPTPNKNFEGYIYPETYIIPEKADEKFIINIFLKEFLKKFPPEEYKDKEEFYKKLILASIIEREIAVKEEKPIAASVFYNRIEKNIPLAADSTINFLFNYEKKRILYKDLEIDSPFNTYKNKGLPPAPICNPTKDSMDAVYNPAKTDFLFFVVDEGKKHFFSKTYGEHIEFQNQKARNQRKK